MAPFEGSASAHPEQGLLSLLAHDLRTPLGPLGLAVTSVAEAESAPASVRELGTMAQAQGNRLARLIDATLAASGRTPYLRRRPAHALDILESAAAQFAALGGSVVPMGSDGDLHCDPDRVRDVLTGLMEVAAGEGGSLSVGTHEQGVFRRFTIPVHRSGVVDEAFRAPFVSDAETAFVLGARAVVRAHGGELHLDAHGFVAVVPVAAPPADAFDPGW